MASVTTTQIVGCLTMIAVAGFCWWSRSAALLRAMNGPQSVVRWAKFETWLAVVVCLIGAGAWLLPLKGTLVVIRFAPLIWVGYVNNLASAFWIVAAVFGVRRNGGNLTEHSSGNVPPRT